MQHKQQTLLVLFRSWYNAMHGQHHKIVVHNPRDLTILKHAVINVTFTKNVSMHTNIKST